MEYIKRSPVKYGLLLALVVLLIAGGAYFAKWWNTPLAPTLDTSSVTPSEEAVKSTEPAATAEPSETPAPTETAPPTATLGATATPEPEVMCGGPETMTVLVTGIYAENYIYGLSDAIRVVRLDFVEGKIIVLPLPRDLYVDIPISVPGVTEEITKGKLNQAYFYGSPGMGYYDQEDYGPGLLAKTLQSNFGVDIDRYLSVNTRVFRMMVDEIGGISVYLPNNVYGHHFNEPVLYMKAGSHHLNGKEAEMIARHRTKIGDFGRVKNQTIILKAFAKRLLTPEGLKNIPDLIELYKDNVVMDFTPNEISKIFCLAGKIDREKDIVYTNFPRQILEEKRVYDEVQGHNTYVLVGDSEEISDLLEDFQEGRWP